MTILIIDDDSSMIEMLLKTIDWEKLEVDTRLTASSAAAARQMIESQPVDLLLCDIEMPGGSGIELLQWMRDRGLETPNIFLTNHTRFDYAQTAIKLGAVDFVSKMSSAQELEDAIRRGVNIVKAQRIQKRYVDYGRYWEENSGLLWRQFWLDLIHRVIQPEREAIRRAAGDPPRPRCHPDGSEAPHLLQAISTGYRQGAALSQPPHGPVRRLLPGDARRGGVPPAHRAGGAADDRQAGPGDGGDRGAHERGRRAAAV